MNDHRLRLLLRSLAIVIVVAALVDPVFTRDTTERAIIAVQQAEDANAATAAEVRRVLTEDFEVIDGPFAAAAATVLIGPRHVQTDVVSPGPVFAVVDTAAALSIEPIAVPAEAALNASVSMRVGLGLPATFRGAVAVSVMHDGVTLDSVAVAISEARATLDTTLTIVPTSPGLWPLRLRAALPTGAVAEYDVVVDVVAERRAVLFFDRRPSYQSTFVRRVVEADPRFRVTHRVLTAREASRGTGAPPATLADAAALDAFDVIVVGAPDALTDADQLAVTRFLRERGGAVVLLLDSITNAAPLRALTGVPSWRDVRGAMSRIAVPSARPAGTTTLLFASVVGSGPTPMVPALWRSSVGAGQLYVSGLLDQWRLRDEPSVAFREFWPALIAEAASTVVAPIELVSVPRLVTPNALVPLEVWITDGSARSALPQVVIIRDSARAADTLSVLRGEGGERVHALWRAPATPGPIEMRFSSGLSTRQVSGLVRSDIRRQGRTDPARRARWVIASGGAEVSPDDIALLPRAITSAIGSVPQQRPWYPMRSPWWIVPFALLLGAEWWLRRRQALP